MRRRWLICLTLASLSQLSFAAVPHLVRDINTQPIGVSSDPQYLGTVGSASYFAATDGVHGVELWKSDGTRAGTSQVMDIEPGKESSNPTDFVTAGSLGYFVATTAATGTELWVTDGSAAGTHMVADLGAGSRSSGPVIAGVLGSRVFFSATNGLTTSTNLYVTDGTAAGTVSLLPVAGFYPNDHALAVASNGKAYFRAYDGGAAVTDGTPAGTRELTPPAGALTFSGSFVQVGGYMYILAVEGTTTNLYRIHLTDDSLEQVPTTAHPEIQGIAALALQPLGNLLIFIANTSGQQQLWRTDGTAAGTFALVNYNSQFGNSYIPPHFQLIGNRMVFETNTASNVPALFSTDGTVAGTVSLLSTYSSLQTLFNTAGPYVFFADGANQIYQTDGTPAGTRVVSVYSNGNPSLGYMSWFGFAADANAAYFGLPGTGGYQITRYDLSSGALTLLKTTTIQPGRLFTLAGGKLFFSSSDPTTGIEPWISDGTVQGTSLLADIAPEPTQAGSNPGNFAVYHDQLYFAADDGLNGRELWRSDGTGAGTQMVADILPGANSSNPNGLFVAGDSLLFGATWPGSGMNFTTLYLYNASSGQSQPISTGRLPISFCNQPPVSTPPMQLQGITYFLAYGLSNSIWRSDGTFDGTTEVTGIVKTTFTPCQMVGFQNQIYFMGVTNQGTGLWATDGADAHTHQVAVASPPTSAPPAFLVAAGGAMYFEGQDAQGTWSLFRSDGTTTGSAVAAPLPDSHMLFLGVVGSKLLFEDPYSQIDGSNLLVFDTASRAFTALTGVNVSQIGPFTANGKLFFFTGWKPPAAATVWVTDGTLEGTQPLVDGQQVDVNTVRWLGDFHNVGIFVAANSQQQLSYWRTDGTSAGTLAIGQMGSTQSVPTSSPVTALAAGNNFFFVLADSVIGSELYALENEAPVASDDSASTTAPTAVTIDVAANDSDPDGHIDPTSVKVVDAPGHGTASVTSDGHIIYTPAAEFSGTDSFTYSIADNQGRTIDTPAHVTVQVAAAPPLQTPPGSSTHIGGSGGGGGGSLDFLLLGVLATCLWRTHTRQVRLIANLT